MNKDCIDQLNAKIIEFDWFKSALCLVKLGAGSEIQYSFKVTSSAGVLVKNVRRRLAWKTQILGNFQQNPA